MKSHHHDGDRDARRWAFNGVEYPTRNEMCEARRAEYVRLLDEEGMNFTQAAHAVGVSKRAGKAWRNGRTRATGRNEKPLVDWYRSTMDKPKRIHARYLSQDERIAIADRLRLGDSIRAIARLLGRDPGTVSREVERNRNPESGGCEPYRAQQKAADRLKRPRPRKAADGTPLWAEIPAGCAGIGARSRYPADRRRCSRIMVTCTQASKPSTRPSTCRPGADSGRS